MPEIPDLTVYVEQLASRLVGHRLDEARVTSPNLLRTTEPPVAAACGRTLERVRRQGKRIVLSFTGDLHLALHLMIAGRLRWRARGVAAGGRAGLATFTFDHGTLTLTEAGTKRRAALHVLAGADAVRALDGGGIEPLEAEPAAFAAALTRENHTLKRALCDPRLFSGIGNAYSDEILFRARLSPLQLSRNLDASEIARLREATRDVLEEWTARLRAEAGDAFPERVTAFHDEMAVHGRFRRPCRVCATPIQRIVQGEHEINYCPQCQTGGRLLADRALSRLLKSDWPRTIQELEDLRAGLALRRGASAPEERR